MPLSRETVPAPGPSISHSTGLQERTPADRWRFSQALNGSVSKVDLRLASLVGGQVAHFMRVALSIFRRTIQEQFQLGRLHRLRRGRCNEEPTDNEPESVWARAVAGLSAGGKVSPMGMKLEGSKLLKFEGGVLDISLPRQMDIGWFNEKPVRLGHIQKLVQDAGGSDWTIRFSLDASQSPRADTGSAVELPLEGPRLEQLVREVFGDNASSPPESTQE